MEEGGERKKKMEGASLNTLTLLHNPQSEKHWSK